MQFFQTIGKWPKPVIVILGFVLVAILGVADYITGPELFFLEVYLLPVILVAWFVSERAGIFVSIASAVCWFIDDVVGRAPHAQPAVPYLNVAVKFLVFLLFIHVVVILKEAIQREKLAEQRRLERDIEIAAQVQKRLFPELSLRLKRLDYAGVCRPAFKVAGDYYDFIPLDREKLAIALGDVAGKGLPSALLMASLHGMLRSFAIQYRENVVEIIHDVNALMCASTDKNKYASLFYGLYDDADQTLTYVNAGHNPPVLLRPANGHSGSGPKGHHYAATTLPACGTVVGLFRDATHRKQTLRLKRGDVLALYTDGITEATDSNDVEFGEDKLLNLLGNHLELSAQALSQMVLDSVNEHTGNSIPQDDQTLVIIKAI
jgi:phosphoserine phosphatase RsbU/P